MRRLHPAINAQCCRQFTVYVLKVTEYRCLQYVLGPISLTDLSLASYHLVLDFSPETDLSLKSSPVL